MGESMNNVNLNTGTPLHLKPFEWIRTTLSYLQDEAAVWATPAMEEMVNRGTPFNGSWADFTVTFKARFKTVDEAVNAKEILQQLTQGSKTVPEYAAKFKEVMDRTGYSSVDLRDWFYNGLSLKIKDKLTHIDWKHDTLDELIAVTTAINVRVREHYAEHECEKDRTLFAF